MKNRSFLRRAELILSVLLAVGVETAFRACGAKDDGTWMHCHSAQNALFGIGAFMAALAAVSRMVHRRIPAALIRLAGAAAALVCVLLPGTLIKMCMMDTMRCYTVMQPFARVMGALLTLVFLIDMLFALSRKESGRGTSSGQ